MIELVVDIVVALLLYLAPGYLLLHCIKFPSLKGTNRFVLAISISLVVVPVTFIVVGNVIPFQPGFFAWLGLVALLGITAWLLHRRPNLLAVDWQIEDSERMRASSRERVAVFVFIVLFAAFVNLPRIMMFLKGGLATEVGPWDETWHVAELVSVARTGIPPAHYFFPSIQLGYYYASWIYPAILGNLGDASISLLRAMSIHVFLQVFAFLGLVYVLLQMNIRNAWIRLVGIAFFSVMGGFDLFVRLPEVDYIDWWTRVQPWLAGNYQISQFTTLYAWVPHHLAAGMGFLLILLLFKNIRQTATFKAACLGILLGFSLSTSPFVFLTITLAISLAFLPVLPGLWANRARLVIPLAVLTVLFVLVAWRQVGVYAAHYGSLGWSDIHLTVLERYRGNIGWPIKADKALTLLGLPLIGGVILFIELGLAFLLYAIWWLKEVLLGITRLASVKVSCSPSFLRSHFC